MPKLTLSGVAKTLKTVTIKNPKNKKDIKLSSALTYGSIYGKDDLAYLAAVEYLENYAQDNGIKIKGTVEKKALAPVTTPADAKVKLTIEEDPNAVTSFKDQVANEPELTDANASHNRAKALANKLGVMDQTVPGINRTVRSILTFMHSKVNTEFEKHGLADYLNAVLKQAKAGNYTPQTVDPKLNAHVGANPAKVDPNFKLKVHYDNPLLTWATSTDVHALATKLGILKTKVPGLTITVERVTEYMSAGSVLVSEKAKALEFLNYVLTSAKDGTFSPNMVKTAAADGNTPPASVPAKFTNPATPLPTISSKTDPNPWELQDVVNTLNLDNLDSGVQTISGISFKMGAIGAYYDSLSGANQTLIKYSLKKTIDAVKAGTHVPGTLLKWTWDELPSPVGSSDDGSNSIAPPFSSATDAKFKFRKEVNAWKPIDSSYSYESLLAKAKTLGIEDTVTPGTSGINVRYALTHPSTSNTYNAALNHLNNLIALAKDGKYFPPNLSSAPAYYVQPSDSKAPEYTNSGVLWGFDTDVDIHTASSYLLNMCDTMGVSDVMSGVKGFDGEELSVAAAVQTAYSLPKTSHDLLIKNIISTVKSINAGTHIVGTFSVDKNSLEASTPIRDDEFTNPNAITKIQKTAGSGAVTQSNASATTLNTYLIALGVSNAKWTTSSGAKLPLNTVASNITMGTESERKQFFGMLNKSIEDAKAGKHVPGTFGDGYETQSAEFTDASKVSDVYTVIGTDSAMWFNKIVEPLGIGDAKTGIPNSTGGMHTVKTALSQLRALSSEERITLAKQVNATLKLAKAGTHKPGHYVKYPDTGEQVAPDSPGTVSKAAKLTDIASVAQVQPIYVSDSVFWFSNLAEKLGVLDADTGIPFWKGGTHTVKSALDNFEYLLHSEKKTIAMQMNNDLDLAKAGLHLQGSYSTGAGDGSVDTAPATVTPPPSAAVQAKPPFSTKVKGIHGIGAKTKITKMRQLARMLGILNDVFSKDSPGVSVNTALGLSYSQPNVYASATSYINTKLTQAKKGQYTPASYNVGSTTTAPVPETPKVVHSNPTSIGPAKVMSDGYTDPTYFKTVQDIETYFPTAAFETLAEKLAILNTKSGMFRQGLEMTVGEAIKYYSSMDSMDKEEFVSSMNRTLAFAKAGDHVPTAFHTGYSVNKKLPPVYTPPAAPPAPYVSAPYVHPTFKEKVKGIKGISEKSTWTKRSALINLLGVKKDIIPAFKSDGTPMTVEDALYGNLEHRQAAMLYVNQKLLAAKKGTYTSPIYAAAAAKTVAAQASYSNPAPATSYAPPPPPVPVAPTKTPFKDKVKGVKLMTQKSSWAKKSGLVKLLGIGNVVVDPNVFDYNGNPITVSGSLNMYSKNFDKAIVLINQRLKDAKAGVYTPDYYTNQTSSYAPGAPTPKVKAPGDETAIYKNTPAYIEAKTEQGISAGSKYIQHDKGTKHLVQQSTEDIDWMDQVSVLTSTGTYDILDQIDVMDTLPDDDKKKVITMVNNTIAMDKFTKAHAVLKAILDASGNTQSQEGLSAPAAPTAPTDIVQKLGIGGDTIYSPMSGKAFTVNGALTTVSKGHPTYQAALDYVNAQVIDYYEKNPKDVTIAQQGYKASPPSSYSTSGPTHSHLDNYTTYTQPEDVGVGKSSYGPAAKQFKSTATINTGKTFFYKDTITNPANGKQISIASALQYKKKAGVTDPTYQAAVAYLDQKVGSELSSSGPVGDYTPLDLATLPQFSSSGETNQYFDDRYKLEYAKLRAMYKSQSQDLAAYAGSGYSSINKCLRKKIDCSSYTASRIENIRTLLKDAPPLTEEMMVVRNVSGLSDLAFHLMESIGGTFTDNGVVSTSAKTIKNTNFLFNQGIQFRIRLPVGTKALSVNTLLASSSPHSSEGEVILPPGAKFKILAGLKNQKVSMYQDITIIDLEYIPGAQVFESIDYNNCLMKMNEGTDTPKEGNADKYAWSMDDINITPPTDAEKRLARLRKIKQFTEREIAAGKKGDADAKTASDGE